MSKPVVAIVGRPNVGKSSLFNTLYGERLSIVADTPGVSATIDSLSPYSVLNRLDLPTFGRPTIATTGLLIMILSWLLS